MAYVRDSDTSLWLHNKLGASNDQWSGHSICSQLNADVLRNIKDCFVDLQSQVKLKLLLAFLHIPRRNLDEWKVQLEGIIDVARGDTDPWVSQLAELLRSYPSSAYFKFDDTLGPFTDLANELRKLVRRHADRNMLPQECLFLNKGALSALVGTLPTPVKHFNLKRGPKSYALRAELVTKSREAASNSKRVSTTPTLTVPIRCRGVTKVPDSSPLRTIPNRLSTGGFKSPSNRLNTSLNRSLSKSSKKDGGIKLLDIAEQPMGRDAKRRKRAIDEERERLRDREDGTTGGIPGKKGLPGTPGADAKQVVSGAVSPGTPGALDATPDYAAGLLATPSQLSVPPSPAPSYAMPLTPKPATPAKVSVAPPASPSVVHHTIAAQSTPTVVTTTVISQQQQQQAHVVQQQIQHHPQVVIQPQQQQPHVVQQQIQHHPQVVIQQQQQQNIQPQVIVTSQPGVQPTVVYQQNRPIIVRAVAARAATPATTTTTTTIVPQQRQLSLSQEQIAQAQEIFRDTNKVSRSEKALILGFIAGNRENPCPTLGDVITIRLSERREERKMPDGSIQHILVETHFQMNYLTGKWERVIKHKAILPSTAAAVAVDQQQQQQQQQLQQQQQHYQIAR